MTSALKRQQQRQLVCVANARARGHGEGGDHREGTGASWSKVAGAGLGLLASMAAPLILAEAEKDKKAVTQKHDRIRQYITADKIFEYFSEYQIVSENGRKTTLMSARNFYNAMTPGTSVMQEF